MKSLRMYNGQNEYTHEKANTVGTYSTGNESVVYDINMHVLPTVPSPTTTHLIWREGADINETQLLPDYGRFRIKHAIQNPKGHFLKEY